ncbi:cupin domain-containing protein [Pontibacter sp. H249]|uniref:cupin domain-containing protein n=1 Tax=Pontibacter sp. H249 TaxID=3133420 RepID=UPI0030BBC17A
MKKKKTNKTSMPPLAAYLLTFLALTACSEQRGVVVKEAKGQQVQQETGDMGKQPWMLDIEEATIANPHYRNTQWTGEHLQLVLMSLKPNEEIDLEVHRNIDQFIRIEQGEALVRMGKSEKELSFERTVSDDWVILIPAGYYHHIRNTGNTELKLYSIYTPAEHPAGTVHRTYEKARQHLDEHN